jgi:hypothetical protein
MSAAGLTLIQKRPDQPDHRNRGGQSQCDPNEYQPPNLAHDERQYVSRASAQGHSHSNFMRSLCHPEGKGAVDSDRGGDQRDARKQRQQPGI